MCSDLCLEYHYGGYEPCIPIPLSASPGKMGTLDNGGCFFDREIKSWLSFRATLCRECDGKELVDINANVLSTVFGLKFRQIFRLVCLLRFAQCCKKARASSYLIRTSSSIARTLLARTTWTLANVDKLTRTRSLKLTISVIWHALKKKNSQFLTILQDAVYPK